MAILSCFPAGGGAKLNVKAYSAVGNLPASDKEGAIAVITSTAIGNVYASVSAPSSPASGDVWVWVGGQSLAPIALTDKIKLYPRAVYQYSGSAWVLKDSYVYTGSTKVKVTLAIYDVGSEILSEMTTGTGRGPGPTPVYTKQSAAVYVTKANGDWAYKTFRTTTTIDLTGISTIKMTFTKTTDLQFRLLIGTASTVTSDTATAYADGTTGTNITKTLDVSGYSGYYFVGIECGTWNFQSGNGYLYKLELIP